jgi:glycosyl transferase family 25
MTTIFDNIEMIVYIVTEDNSDSINKISIPENKLLKINEIKNNNPALSCVMTHIHIMTLAKEKQWKNILVLENNFHFIDDIPHVNNMINYFFDTFKDNWDVINLNRGYYQSLYDININNILGVNDNSSSAAYLVNNHFYDKLINNYENGYKLLEQNPMKENLYCISRYWTSLQKESMWYVFNPSLGYINTMESSIEYDNSLLIINKNNVLEELPRRERLRLKRERLEREKSKSIVEETSFEETILKETILKETILEEKLVEEKLVEEKLVEEKPVIPEKQSFSANLHFYDMIDMIVYINLDKRKDRDDEIKEEFKRLQIPSNKIMRFKAIENKEGAIGCTMSHIEVIKLAKQNKWNNILVLEDDFNFINDIDFINNVFKLFFSIFKNDWDVINLSRGFYQSFTDINIKYFSKVNDVSTTSGYMVNNTIYDKLIENFEEGCGLLKQNPRTHELYCIDRYWTKLLSESRWYIFTPSIGYQRTGFSSIGNIVVDYIVYDKTLTFDKIHIDNTLIHSSNDITTKINYNIDTNIKINHNINTNTINSIITIVTCFYDLKKKSKIDTAKYYIWMKNFLNKPMNIIIYLDKDDMNVYDFIIECRKDYLNRTHIIFEKIEEWETYKYIDYWNYCHTIDSENSYHSPELYMLWNEKTFFIKRAMQKNPFNSEWFFWTDIGCCRNDSDSEKFMSYPSYNKVINYSRNKIILSFIDEIKHYYYNLNSVGIPLVLQNISNDRACNPVNGVQGGFFGGHMYGLNLWFNLYQDTLKLFMDNKVFGGKDQNLMITIAIKHGEHVEKSMATSRYGDIWFDFLHRFS